MASKEDIIKFLETQSMSREEYDLIYGILVYVYTEDFDLVFDLLYKFIQ